MKTLNPVVVELRYLLRRLAAALSSAAPHEDLVRLVWQARSAAVKAAINDWYVRTVLRKLYRDLIEERPLNRALRARQLRFAARRL